jgi:ribosomal protein S27E
VVRVLRIREILEQVIAVKPASGSTFHGKVDHSQPPWCAPVANVIMDLHALAREMEAILRLRQGFPHRERGGSDGNTRKALAAILRLAEAADDGTVRENILFSRPEATETEWREACRDLGIPDEKRTHQLPFVARRMRRRYQLRCPGCGESHTRVRRPRRRIACLACCRLHCSGAYDDRFRFQVIEIGE